MSLCLHRRGVSTSSSESIYFLFLSQPNIQERTSNFYMPNRKIKKPKNMGTEAGSLIFFFFPRDMHAGSVHFPAQGQTQKEVPTPAPHHFSEFLTRVLPAKLGQREQASQPTPPLGVLKPASPCRAGCLCSPRHSFRIWALQANRVAAGDWWSRRSQSEGGTSR